MQGERPQVDQTKSGGRCVLEKRPLSERMVGFTQASHRNLEPHSEHRQLGLNFEPELVQAGGEDDGGKQTLGL